MRATDIIRQVLNMIDAIDTNAAQGAPHELETNVPTIEIIAEPIIADTDELERMRQIAGLVTPMDSQYSTMPNERIASIDAVTTNAGGGLNGPKHPADIRTDSQAMYPNTSYGDN